MLEPVTEVTGEMDAMVEETGEIRREGKLR